MKTVCSMLLLLGSALGQGGMMPGPGTPNGGGGGHPPVFSGVTNVWTMSEAANTTRVDSVSTNNLADVNSNIGVTTGLLHTNAANITGGATQLLHLGSTITDSNTGPYTWVFWFKTADDYGLFLARATDGSVSYAKLNNTVSYLADSGSGVGYAIFPSPPSTGTWHMFAIVMSPCVGSPTNGCATFYLDNVNYPDSAGGNFSSNFLWNYIGADGSVSLTHTLVLGDVFHWNGTALSAGNISTLWNGGAGLAY